METKNFTPQLPLFDFFQALRDWERNDLQRGALTIHEYEVLLKALDNCPFALKTSDDYYRLCKLVLFKPYHAADMIETADGNLATQSDHFFRQKFDAFWKNLNEFLNPIAVVETPRSIEATPTTNEAHPRTINAKPEQTHVENNDTVAQKPEADKIQENKGLTDFWINFDSPKSGTTPASELVANADSNSNSLTTTHSFTFLNKNKLLPLDIRRMYQLLMTLRRTSLDGEKSDFDFDTSLQRMLRQGYIFEFEYRRRARRWLGVHLLLDCEGSMVAFEHIGDLMADFIRHVGGNKSSVWYFQNCPNQFVYQDKDQRDAVVLDEWLKTLDKQSPTQILIFSDAGAARGFRNPERLANTTDFLKKIKKHRVVWLNPMQQARWQDNSAAVISQKIPMFDMSDAGFVAAMQAISGKK